jgi:hypothetical protein
MSGLENYAREAQQIELEIERKGVVLGIDWDDEPQVRAIARKALAGSQESNNAAFHGLQWNDRAMVELFALSQLMLTVMQQSAAEGMQTHGGRVWKSLGRALWIEAGANGLVDAEELPDPLSLRVSPREKASKG